MLFQINEKGDRQRPIFVSRDRKFSARARRINLVMLLSNDMPKSKIRSCDYAILRGMNDREDRVWN